MANVSMIKTQHWTWALNIKSCKLNSQHHGPMVTKSPKSLNKFIWSNKNSVEKNDEFIKNIRNAAIPSIQFDRIDKVTSTQLISLTLTLTRWLCHLSVVSTVKCTHPTHPNQRSLNQFRRKKIPSNSRQN